MQKIFQPKSATSVRRTRRCCTLDSEGTKRKHTMPSRDMGYHRGILPIIVGTPDVPCVPYLRALDYFKGGCIHFSRIQCQGRMNFS